MRADIPLPAAAVIDPTLSRRGQAYALLRDAIVSLWLKPGEPISEKSICDQLGISRTPVREALALLAEEGLVKVFPQSGTFVSPIELEQVFEGQIVRGALETAMARRAAARFTPEDERRFGAMLDEQRRVGGRNDYQAFYILDEEFHRAISLCAGSPRIWRIINSAKAQLDRVRRLNIPVPGQLDQIIKQHEAIVAGLCSGREALAGRAMKAHLDMVFENVQVVMQRNAEYFSSESLARQRRSSPAIGARPQAGASSIPDAPRPVIASEAKQSTVEEEHPLVSLDERQSVKRGSRGLLRFARNDGL